MITWGPDESAIWGPDEIAHAKEAFASLGRASSNRDSVDHLLRALRLLGCPASREQARLLAERLDQAGRSSGGGGGDEGDGGGAPLAAALQRDPASAKSDQGASPEIA